MWFGRRLLDFNESYCGVVLEVGRKLVGKVENYLPKEREWRARCEGYQSR